MRKKNSCMTRAKNKPAHSWISKTLLIINFIFIFFLGLAYMTPFVPVERWGWLSLLALAYPFLMLVNGIFAVMWILARKWYAILSILILLAGFPHHIQYVKLFSNRGRTSTCKESIRVLSYNLRGLSLVPAENGKNIDAKIDTLLKALHDLEEYPDILCLQETVQGEKLAKKFGLEHTLHAPQSTLWLLSRYPILTHGVLDGEEVGPSAMWADLKTPQGTLRVYNMHLVSNRVTQTAEELIQDMDLQREHTWKNIRFILQRYRKTTEKRAIEAHHLRRHLADCPHPAIVAGDANDTPLSRTYRVLSDGLNDSFSQRGSGFSTTYKSTLPLLRIDYLLGTDQIFFKDHHTWHLPYSDHYPIATGICLQPASGS